MDNQLTQWLLLHWGYAAFLAGITVLAGIKWGPRLWRTYSVIKKELHDTQTRLSDGYKAERDELEKRYQRLSEHIRTCEARVFDLQQDLNTRADIAAQDRAYIRGLQRLLRDAGVDYEDLRRAIVDEFLEHKTWE